MANFSQLVIVCRNLSINWKQFSNPIYVGVESGVLALLENNLPIAFVTGDFDSVSESDFQLIKESSQERNFKIVRANSKKDYLDSELAIITSLEQKLVFQQIVLITDGSRWDMMLAQINFLRKYRQYQPILIDQDNYIFALEQGTKFTFSLEHLKYRYLSFFSLDQEDLIYNLTGCKYYPNLDITVNNQDILAVSNEFDLQIDKNPTIEIKKGNCLVCLSEKLK